MADEIKINSGMSLTNGTLKSPLLRNDFDADQTVARVLEDTQNITTSSTGEALNLGSISTIGWAYFKNLDATNFVTIGPDNGGGTITSFVKIEPGETAGPIKINTTSIRAKSDTLAVELWYRIYEA